MLILYKHETYDATTMPTVAKIYKYAIGDGIANPSAAGNKSIFSVDSRMKLTTKKVMR